jgi:hypothetical protein
MAQRKYAAFAGLHNVDAGRRRQVFEIVWAGRGAVEILNVNRPPGHADRVKTGWYWYGAGAEAGPFSSSRKAYQDARLRCRKQ